MLGGFGHEFNLRGYVALGSAGHPVVEGPCGNYVVGVRFNCYTWALHASWVSCQWPQLLEVGACRFSRSPAVACTQLC